jgi:hypothetical protein
MELSEEVPGRDSNQGPALGQAGVLAIELRNTPKSYALPKVNQTAKDATKDCVLRHSDIKMLFDIFLLVDLFKL